MGERRPVSGFLLVDKPTGKTSFAVVGQVRRRLDVKQVGHTGTLDPLASGLLPILVGEATKLTPLLMGLDKEYVATVRFGAATDTYDAEGRVTRQGDPSSLDEATVRAALPRFIGRIEQRPPAYSAIKRDGQRLYDIARAAAAESPEAVEAIVVDEREVIVYELELVQWRLPDAQLRVRCGKGTYVRSIAHDLGTALGVPAHLVALRRTRIGQFRVEDAVDVFGDAFGASVDDARAALEPMERAIDHLPAAVLSVDAERRLRMGQQAALQSLEVPLDCHGALRLVDDHGRLVAIAEAAPGRIALSRVFASQIQLDCSPRPRL